MISHIACHLMLSRCSCNIFLSIINSILHMHLHITSSKSSNTTYLTQMINNAQQFQTKFIHSNSKIWIDCATSLVPLHSIPKQHSRINLLLHSKLYYIGIRIVFYGVRSFNSRASWDPIMRVVPITDWRNCWNILSQQLVTNCQKCACHAYKSRDRRPAA